MGSVVGNVDRNLFGGINLGHGIGIKTGTEIPYFLQISTIYAVVLLSS